MQLLHDYFTNVSVENPYFNGQIQLLLPLCLVDPDKTDLALVVTKNSSGSYYQGHTCLTLEMAYNNARLIAKPESNWLNL